MRVLVTGSRGKVGRYAVRALHAAGHEVVGVDLAPPGHEAPDPDVPHYVQADLTDAGAAFAVIHRFDAVVHAAALPEPTGYPAHVVFRTNLMATFNTLEAALRSGVHRFVYLSSESVYGHVFPEVPFLPDYLPVDEEHPVRPQDPYALSKWFGEQLMDAAVRRSAISCVSLRPTWVQTEEEYERNLGAAVRDPARAAELLWNYLDVRDLADAIVLAVERESSGHQVFLIAGPDNPGGRDLAEQMRLHHPGVEPRPTARPDAGGVSWERARRVLGWRPVRSWRDHLDKDGLSLRPEQAPEGRAGGGHGLP